MKRTRTAHRDLCFSLAEAKGTQYVEVPLGSMWMQMGKLGIADVVSVRPSYTRFTLDIYECKVTRNDLLSDLRTEKYRRYLEHCHRLYFACLSGVVHKDELPEGIGLIVRGEKGWSTVCQAQRRELTIPEETLLSLLFYRGRVFNPRRENLLRTCEYPYYYSRRLTGLDKRIKTALMEYEVLERKYEDVMYKLEKMKND